MQHYIECALANYKLSIFSSYIDLYRYGRESSFAREFHDL